MSLHVIAQSRGETFVKISVKVACKATVLLNKCISESSHEKFSLIVFGDSSAAFSYASVIFAIVNGF